MRALPGVRAMMLVSCAASLLSALAGCSDAGVPFATAPAAPDPEPVPTPEETPLFTTEHFEYYQQEGAAPVCAEAAAEWLERYYAAYSSFVGVELPPGKRIKYFHVANRASLNEKVGCELADGCAKGLAVGSLLAILPHELVHAVASLHNRAPSLFSEGLAEVLSCSSIADTAGEVEMTVALEELVESNAFAAIDDKNELIGAYGASKSFVRYLIDQYGAPAFLSFYGVGPHDGTRAQIAEAFASSFGVGLDEAFADWRARPTAHHDEVCLRVTECASTMPSLVDGDVHLRCGPTGDLSFNRDALLRFEVPEGGRLPRFRTTPVKTNPAVSSLMELYRCDGGQVLGFPEHTAGLQFDDDGELQFDPAQPSSELAFDVPAGNYLARFVSHTEADVHVDVEDQPSPMRGAGCAPAAQPLALGRDFQTTLGSRWAERPCDGPWCPGAGFDVSVGAPGGVLEVQAPVILDVETNFAPEKLYVCTEPCPANPSDCEVLVLDTEQGSKVRTQQTFASGTVLYLGAPYAPDSERLTIKMRVVPPER